MYRNGIIFCFYLFFNKMSIDLNMLCPVMVHMILCYIDANWLSYNTYIDLVIIDLKIGLSLYWYTLQGKY